MIPAYFYSYVRANKGKTAMLIISVALYFAVAVLTITLGQALPKLATIPLQRIGAGVMVQTEGVIPDRLEGIVFPHANGPIYLDQFQKLARLRFVNTAEGALYFWDFTGAYKSIAGFDPQKSILAEILKKSIDEGRPPFKSGQALVSYDYKRKNNLRIGRPVKIYGQEFNVVGVLQPTSEAQIMPADIYISYPDAWRVVGSAKEIRRNYRLRSDTYFNVVLLRVDPGYQGNKTGAIKAVDKRFLVFSEESFSTQILSRLRWISGAGKTGMGLLAVIVVAAFCALVFYMIKSREREIAILRALGWPISAIRGQFIREISLLVGAGLVAGNIVVLAASAAIAAARVSIEVPWEISAKPHFLPEANAINRTITAPIPISINLWLNAGLVLIFAVTFMCVSMLVLERIKRIQALQAMLR